jgi:hypothetical protein
MPEFLRSIINRLREHVGNRRAAPRYVTHLEVGLILNIALSESGKRASAEGSALRLTGYTRDISRSGLALIVPTIRIGGQYLTSQHRTLELTLKLPTGMVQLQGTPVRYSPLEDEGRDTGYIIGLLITQMDAADRARYDAYLDKLIIEV